MASPIPVRNDYSAVELCTLARGSSDANQCRRLLALAAILDGGSRSEAARIGGVGLQIVRDWALRFNADGPDGLIDRKAPGKATKLNPDQQIALALKQAQAFIRDHPDHPEWKAPYYWAAWVLWGLPDCR